MAGTVVLCMEGVLVRGHPPNGEPVWVGLQMYHALRSQFRLVLDTTHDDFTDIEHWCAVNGLKSHVLTLAREAGQDGLHDLAVRLGHLREWRSQGFDISLYVTAEPATAANMLREGVPTLLLAHPAYARPEFRPDHERGMKPWAEIEDEVTEAAKVKDTVVRVDADMQP